MPIPLGKSGFPLDWAELQRRAQRALGRAVVIPCLVNDFIGEELTKHELWKLGFKFAANPALVGALGLNVNPGAFRARS